MPRNHDSILAAHMPQDNALLKKKLDNIHRHLPSMLPPPELQRRISQQHTNAHKTPAATTVAAAVNWETTLERCIKSIVSIKACRPRGIDTEVPGAFTATGFVVDPENGIILSNRHVVSVSPIRAYAVLCNYEEVELKAIYRDPVHDFGFFQYNPCKVRFLDIPGIELYPQGAKIGQDIRVVGNDAGEKLSILSGTLARLDRDAPVYGQGEYNDFNTFYYQAASSTSSGSSGSPVLDISGRAIALNAGGASTSSSSYYLPLDRAQRALELIRNGQSIPRGSIQTVFEYQAYDALLQLGLGRPLEARLRAQSQKNEGLLVVKSVLQDGPAYNVLEPGDILLTCNGALLPRLFIDLEQHVDDAVGQEVTMVVCRAGEMKEVSMRVEASETPCQYLEFGGGVLNDLSYQMARSYGLSLKEAGVYVGAAGFLLGSARALRKSVIVGVNNKPVRSLAEFVEVVSQIEQGKRVPIRFYTLARPMKVKVMILHVDWRWHKFQLATRNDSTGFWDYQVLQTPLTRVKATLLDNSSTIPLSVQEDPLQEDESPVVALKRSLVSVDCTPPFVIDGSKNPHSYGAGIVVSLNPPLILCDRDTVPISISVISVTFESSLTVSAELVFLHPFYNYALLKFDPKPVIDAGIKMYAATLDDQDFHVGDEVYYIGLSGTNEVNVKKTLVTSVGPIRTTETSPPRWRATNVEAFKVSDGNLASQGGMFADSKGRVRAIWMSFSIEGERGQLSSILGGLPCRLIAPVVNTIKTGGTPLIRGLDAEFWSLQISNARLVGVSDVWINKIKSKPQIPGHHPTVVYILGVTDMSSPSGQMLKPGDILLSINDTVISNISDLGYFHQEKTVQVIILRNGQEMNLTVPTTQHDGKETTEVVGWQGMLIQKTYSAAREQAQKKVPEGVYVSSCLYGSPAQASLRSGIWITQIDGVPVKTLSDFLKAVDVDSVRARIHTKRKQQKADSSQYDALFKDAVPDPLYLEDVPDMEYDENHVLIQYVTPDNVMQVRAITLDRHYWPTWHIQKNEASPYGWDMAFPSK